MDNGLIFPYPLTRANAEASDTNHGEASPAGLRVLWGVADDGIWTGSR